jgi:hypothetical protein
MKKKNIITAALLFTVLAPLGCGGGSGGGGQNDFKTADFEVSYDKDESTKDLPTAQADGDHKLAVACGGKKDTENGAVIVACKEQEKSVYLICVDGAVASISQEGTVEASTCQAISLTCDNQGFTADCKD